MSLYNLTEVIEVVETSTTEAEARARLADMDARYQAEIWRTAMPWLVAGALISVALTALSAWGY